MTRTIEAVIPAWLRLSKYISIDILDGDPMRAVTEMAFTASDMTELPDSPYVRVGTATISVALFDRAKTTMQSVAVLRAEADRVRAASGAALVEIDRRINELLAIENERAA